MSESSEIINDINNNNVKKENPSVDLRPLAYSIGAFAIVAFCFLIFNIWKEANDRNIIVNYGSKNLYGEHFWGDEREVKVNWLIHRSNFIQVKNGVESIQVFVKADVSNESKEKYLSVFSITLDLLTKSGVTISSYTKTLSWEKLTSIDADYRIEPDKSKEVTFNYWVPVKIYEEIESLSARLGYSLSK